MRAKNNNKKSANERNSRMDRKSNQTRGKSQDKKSQSTNRNATRPIHQKKNAKATTPDQKIQAIAKELKELYGIQTRLKNDDFIIDSITGVRSNDISLWPSERIRLMRTISSLPTKIKSSTPLKSDEQLFKEFEATQSEPILNTRLVYMVRKHIQEVMETFDYQQVVDDIKDPFRVKMITSGSSFPNLPAPVISGLDGNADMLCGMAVGRKVFDHDFDARTVLEGIADGKMITVDKNYKSNRAITMGSTRLIDEQNVVAVALRDFWTKRSRNTNHILQFDDQTVQHQLLEAGECATIDLSSASDRVYVKLVKQIWPEFMEYFGYLLPKDIVLPTGKIIQLTCVGTQGYPLTFALMAFVCAMIVETVKLTSKPSSNYGDDIIVPEADFEEVYTSLEALGLVVNRSKTHRSSDGFCESCGHDIHYTKYGPRVITPVYLRDVSDVSIVQFFHQLCDAGLIQPNDATSIMDRLKVEFYAFEYEYQLTQFHFPHGDVLKHVPKYAWDAKLKHYVCSVPVMAEEISSIKGLNKSESSILLQMLRVTAALKNMNTYTKYRIGADLVARQHGLIALQGSRYFDLVNNLDNADVQVHVHYEQWEQKYNVTFRTLVFYRFITTEMNRYKYSTPTVDFSLFPSKQLSLAEFIESNLGINSEVKYPIYRYTAVKSMKLITHPRSNEILGVKS